MALPLILAYLAKRKYQPQSRLRGVLRVAGYGLAVSVVALGYSVHSARAGISNAGFKFGEQLRPFTEQANLSGGQSSRVVINGETLSVAETSSDKAPKEILDFYQAECSENEGPLATGWEALTVDGKKQARELGLKDTLSSFRSERSGEGFILCFTKGSESRSNAKEAVQAFLRTHDLGAIGKLRYAYVVKKPSGRSSVITAWTEDRFNFDHIAPRDGSEPFGSDPAGLPRIPNSQRVLDASLPETEFAIHAYKTELSPEAGLSFYNDFFKANGWDNVQGVVPGGIKGKGFTKNGNTFIVSAFTDKQSDKTLVAIGTMGNPHLVKFH